MNLLLGQGTFRSPRNCPAGSDGSNPAGIHSGEVGRNCLLDDEENENRRREQEMWAMLAGQAAFKFESYIFHQVLPESLIKPHIFPRHVKDMQALIEKYTARGEADRLEGAASKWEALKNKWRWKREHAVVLATVKCAYLHISKPLEVMMKLDKEHGDSVENARKAFRYSLLPQLHKAGEQVVEMMHSSGLLTSHDHQNGDRTTSDEIASPEVSRGPPRSAPMTVPIPSRKSPVDG